MDKSKVSTISNILIIASVLLILFIGPLISVALLITVIWIAYESKKKYLFVAIFTIIALSSFLLTEPENIHFTILFLEYAFILVSIIIFEIILKFKNKKNGNNKN